MDYRLYKQYTRSLTSINLVLAAIYLLSFFTLYGGLQQKQSRQYFIENNQGFMFKIEPSSKDSSTHEIIKVFFN
jgi:hypothetical protein